MKQENTKILVWLDLETTGLSLDIDSILEVGITITTKDLEKVASKSWVVGVDTHNAQKVCSDYVLEMHTVNGLWADCKKSEMSLKQIAKEAASFIVENGGEGSPMCGSNIAFDRGFVKSMMPCLNEVFHYRNIDVSTLKNVMATHFPNAVPFQFPENKSHRALDDLDVSIEEYRHYIESMVVKVTPGNQLQTHQASDGSAAIIEPWER